MLLIIISIAIAIVAFVFVAVVRFPAQFWGSMIADSVSVWLDTFRRLSNSLDMPWLPLDLDRHLFLQGAVALVQGDVIRLRLRLRLWGVDLADAHARRHLALLALPVALRLA